MQTKLNKIARDTNLLRNSTPNPTGQPGSTGPINFVKNDIK